jgi:hypothetical protein
LIKEGNGYLSLFNLVPITMGSVFHHGPVPASMLVRLTQKRPTICGSKLLGISGQRPVGGASLPLYGLVIGPNPKPHDD